MAFKKNSLTLRPSEIIEEKYIKNVKYYVWTSQNNDTVTLKMDVYSPELLIEI
jgi:hypothetical protein